MLARIKGVFARLPFVLKGGSMSKKDKKAKVVLEPKSEDYSDYGEYLALKKALEAKKANKKE